MSRPQALKRSWSFTGTPSISQMTRTGSGYANSSIRSIWPFPAASASRSSTICWMWGRRLSSAFGVKALLTSPRRRVWSGGSRSSMESPRPGGGTAMPKRAATKAAMGSLMRRGSRSMAITSG